MSGFEVLNKHFTAKELEEMSEYQKTRFKNQVENYRKMESLGLNIPLPQFMKKIIKPEAARSQAVVRNEFPEPEPENKENIGKKKRQRRTGDSGDEEWQPEPKNNTKKYTTKSRNKVIKSVADSRPTAERYPKRSRTVASYQEAYVPDCDDFIYCDECEREWEGDCEEHPLTIVLDNPVPVNESDPERAIKTAPSSLSIGPSKIPNAGEGVWSKEVIPYRTRFGPYEGKKVPPSDETGYGWLIRKDNKGDHCVDGSSPGAANWMRYVNCARHVDEQNLMAYQYRGKIYYRTTREIAPLTELLVHYGDDYAKELGIETKEFRSENKHLEDLLFPCTTCTLTFASPVYLKRHLCTKKWQPLKENEKEETPVLEEKAKEHTEEKRFSCDKCTAKFSTSGKLKSHNRIHTGEKPFSCDQCDKQFSSSGYLITHKRIHTGEKPYSCDKCTAHFSDCGAFQRHKRIHTGEKPYSCDKCNKQFSISYDLKRHYRIHTGEKPYSCDKCTAHFSDCSAFQRHKRIHTGEKPFSCDKCPAGFSASGDLQRHQRIHTGEKPYSCDKCAAQFTLRSHLKSHYRIHTGEKPYSCDKCAAQFTLRSHLKSHYRIHTGEKPYSCDKCAAQFTLRSHLKSHYRIHTGEKPYSCGLAASVPRNSQQAAI